jgi:hypothetical protein
VRVRRIAWALLLGACLGLAGDLIGVAVVEADGPRRNAQQARERRQRERERVERRQTKARRAARAKARAARPRVKAGYRRMRDRWHKAASPRVVQAWLARTPPPLVLAPAGSSERFVIEPAGDEGGFDAADLANAARAFATHHGRVERVSCIPEARLLDLIYQAMRHFRAPWVTIVSAWRPDRTTSRHSQCRAADVVLPGVSDERLAAHFRRQGFAGVGIYPTSGFVHIDVRGRSYFWVDRSGPGQDRQLREIRPGEARAADRRARSRGVTPGLTATNDIEIEIEEETSSEGPGGSTETETEIEIEVESGD